MSARLSFRRRAVGNAAGNSIEGAGLSVFDMAMTKVFPLKESRMFEVRMSATNIFNHPALYHHRIPCELAYVWACHIGGRMRSVLMTARYRFRTMQRSPKIAVQGLMALAIVGTLLCLTGACSAGGVTSKRNRNWCWWCLGSRPNGTWFAT